VTLFPDLSRNGFVELKQIRYHEESDPFVALNVKVNVESASVALRLTWFGR
jgi:hypothetical protein